MTAGQPADRRPGDRHRARPLSLRLSPELLERAESKSAELGMPLRRLLIGAISKWLDEHDEG